MAGRSLRISPTASALQTPGAQYQTDIQSPYAASAANASGFLLVSLSKMPRIGAHVFAPAVCAEAFPIKANDKPASWIARPVARFSGAMFTAQATDRPSPARNCASPNSILEDYRLSTSQSTSDWPLWQSIENKEPCGWLLALPRDDLVGAPFLLGLALLSARLYACSCTWLAVWVDEHLNV